uniref:Endonuclease/exonuclease/phosphatase domain-containing protein n=1 Tax=Chenopodium quinoa TaxID=63459 RepID=A0A803LM21_CHEQI
MFALKKRKWSCVRSPVKGFGASELPKVPYIASLVRSNYVDIVFLAETMVSVQYVENKLASLACSGYVGVDLEGLSGGLFLFWFSPILVEPLLVSPQVKLCKIVENLVIKHVPVMQVADRFTVWSDISDIIASYMNFLLIGDFNQVDSVPDKVGGNPDIQGRYDFIQWRLDMGLIDIPFSGPAFTWTNGRTMADPTFERLDKAYATSLWLHDRLATSVQHQPILFSNHAAIILCDSLPAGRCKRPYWIENWCLHGSEVADMVQSIFMTYIPGSHMFSLSKKLCFFDIAYWLGVFLIRSCGVLIRKRWWLRMEKIAEARDAFLFWKQRAKVKWDAFGEEHTRLLFSVVQARKRRNTITGLQDNAGAWVMDVGSIRTLALDFFQLPL